ncbi:unnamed protein product [Rotaria magnacalcarata]|uniref:CCHC-type domain-containing protein n=3 Tax=Rotaria magnacalcarata TaxID=392030 RepID=A0A814VAU1_9BILA|nr:unnamed protein product [Rotaria magnacalcarata]CAF2046316.1 unnamed protein product [Rotaria magnacalcarata]CAF2206626.1 unnamed protein product [Rotaria magnacalcarata]CAF2209133.1 unnamed protein product [Rotaria magnacalcarata]CAF4086091.1 unnamed protein product [Rotaria magnacalcarata]
MSYETYENVSAMQKDLICEGFDIQQRIKQHNDNEKNETPSSTLKRHTTNHSQINDDQYTDEYQDDDIEFQQINYNRQRKKRINKENDQRIHARTIINSNINNHRNLQTTITTTNNNIIDNSIRVSKHALDYASEYHHQPIIIECDPKLKDQREGSKFIQAFINYIKIDFYNQNVSYNKPLLFDLWWIDKEGNIRAITKSAEIAVYLSQVKRYPTEINSIKITPHPPNHLPVQHTAILKWVKNSISFNDLKDEIKNKYNSLFLIEEIMGTINDRNRHIRIELLDKKEYNAMLNSGKISIFGQLYDIDEFLPSPKLLICSKCNQPGHVKSYCKSASFDICRRCGNDRNNNDNHKECKINCHHCKGDHVSTDYKCPFIQEYRRRLIIELRKHPELLPPDIQLFIPSQYREQGERTKTIFNKSALNCQQRFDQQGIYDRNDFNVWPQISSHSSNTNMESSITNIQQTLNDETKAINNELKLIKKNFEEEQRKIENNYKQHLNTIKQGWLLMQQKIETQSQILSTINTAISQTLFSTCQKTINVMYNVINKIKLQTNLNDYDDVLNEMTIQASFINDIQATYSNHQVTLEKLLNRQNEALGNTWNLLSENTNGQ